MDDLSHPTKRRRLDHEHSGSPVESSSDELAATSDHDDSEHRRSSWSVKKSKSAYAPKRPYNRARSFGESESSDELAVDADVYWGRNTRQSSPQQNGRGRRGSSSRNTMSSSLVDRRGRSGVSRERYGDEGGYGERDEEEEEREEGEGEGGDTPREEVDREETTPIPAEMPVSPPPPPKPERLFYREKFLLRGHLRGVSAVQFSPDGSMIASGGADGAVKVWDALSGKLIHTFEGHLAGISTICWGPDGAIIASGSDDKTIRLWNVLTGKAHPVPFIGHHNYVYQIAFSPKGNILVSGSYDEAVFLWDVRSATVMQTLPAHSDPVAGIDVVHDGTLIASCALDGLIRIWDTGTGQCLRTLVHEDNPPVTAVKFSPNGKFVLAWTLDNCVRLWNYVDGRCIKTYQGHANQKYSLSGGFGAYNAPGGPLEAFAVSGSEDGSVLCWDVVSKKILQRLEGHVDAVLGVDTCSVHSRRLMASCGLDRTVRVWEEGGEDDESQENDTVNGDRVGNNAAVNGDDAPTGPTTDATTTTTTTAAAAATPAAPTAEDGDMNMSEAPSEQVTKPPDQVTTNGSGHPHPGDDDGD